MNQPAPRVLVVDDQTLVRQGIGTLLELAGVEVISQAADGAEALRACCDHTPDVILLDLRMPVYDGLWFLDKQSQLGIEIPTLVLTTFDDDTAVFEALRAGARGYLLKDVTVDQLSHAIESLASGGNLIGPSINDRLVRAIQAAPPPAGADQTVVEALTDREIEVLRLVARGYSNRQIAGLIHLAEGTVKNHISATLMKLGARDRTNAVLRAIREGMLG
ncbi:LuxR family two component transcriptional regulator [Stackebrandtia endophytica]|uniref:LuxR family two component transcriptional regulator n=1 Tax=Stackebrandtia endophytica TaxID=1496996 RepID=A0A543AQ11_9ACTN|nr:response regulator transcription factor [Stackebrandtia endophytica]TQL74660.1 LuxR family two component transcriptional regulator [Stackebrandtia endophytica]